MIPDLSAMADLPQISKRKEPRFKICDGSTLACDAAVGEKSLSQGSVIDISATGMRLLCKGQFEPGQSFAVELMTNRSHGVYGGKVRRVQPWVGGQTILGCQLDDPIPADVLEDLAGEGVVNRRNDERVVWEHPAQMSWELQPGEIDISIVDYSPGGMKVYSQHEIPENVRLRIRVETPDDDEIVVAATTVWKTEDDQGFQAGLAFTSRDAPEKIDRLHRDSEDPTPIANRPRRIRQSIMVAAALILLAVTSIPLLPIIETFVAAL